ncbi:MAG: shikimate kinase [Nitrospinales bacterium]
MNIVLLGFRGTGKSVVANVLAKKLKRNVFSIDRMIADEAGLKIPLIVEKFGWSRFREIESEMVLKVVSKAKNAIIDCGGGVVLIDENIRVLKEGGKTVLLRANLDTIIGRIKNDANRPPLKSGMSFEEEQKHVLSERESKYNAAADYICDTTSIKPEQTAENIIKYFKDNKWIESL